MTAPYTRHELEAMLADLESDLVERKESRRLPPHDAATLSVV